MISGLPVIRWVEYNLKDEFDHNLSEGIGFEKDGKLVCGVVYSNYRDTDIEMSVYCSDKKFWNKAVLRAFFLYPFEKLGCRRVTAIILKQNKPARLFCERLGFVLEGVMKEALDDGDACIYGLLKRNCKWIENGQKISTKAA